MSTSIDIAAGGAASPLLDAAVATFDHVALADPEPREIAELTGPPMRRVLEILGQPGGLTACAVDRPEHPPSG